MTKFNDEVRKNQFLAGLISENKKTDEQSSESKRNQVLIGLISENNEHIENKENDIAPKYDFGFSKPIIKGEVTPENEPIINKITEVMDGLFYKLDITPSTILLSTLLYKKLPLNLLAGLRSELDVYEDDELAKGRYYYQVGPKKSI